MKKKNKRKFWLLLFYGFLLFIFSELYFYPLKSAFFGGSVSKVDHYISSIDNLQSLVPGDSEMFRVFPVRSKGDVPYPYTAASVEGFYDVRSKSPIVPSKLFDYMIDSGEYSSNYYDLLNVKYFLVGDGSMFKFKEYVSSDIVKVGEIENVYVPYYSKNEIRPIYVYENKNRLGPAWLVDALVFVDSDNESMKELSSADISSTAVVNRNGVSDDLLEGLYSLNGNVDLNYIVKLVDYDPEYISINVDTNKSSVLVLSEQYYPGWRVYVNGNRSNIFEVDYFLRGILLDEGVNFVEFTYVPSSFYLGVVLASFGIFFVIASSVLFFIKPEWFKFDFEKN